MSGLSPEYQTRNVELNISGLAVGLSLVTNTDELMEQLLSKGEEHPEVRDERIPYWADLWPSAIELSRFMVEEQLVRPGMRVTEIGCGLGLPGIVAGMLGAEVTFTDYLKGALELARHNWNRQLKRPARFIQMDWRDADPALAADLVLASDVAYEARAFDPLPEAFRTLCAPGGSIVLSEPSRSIARPFLQALPKHGFKGSHRTYDGRFEQVYYRVKVYHLHHG